MLAVPQTISLAQYRGQEEALFDKYMDTELTDKSNPESKAARNLLGLGMIEATGVKKSTGCNTLRDLVEWYSSAQVPAVSPKE